MKTGILAMLLVSTLARPALADCAADFKAMSAAIAAAGPFHYAVDGKDGGEAFSLSFDFIVPQAMHMTMPGQEVIVTAKEGWSKDASGWQPLPPGVVRAYQDDLVTPWYQRAASNLKCPGQRKFGGKAYAALTFDLDAFMGAQATHHLTVYTNAKKLPVAIEAEKVGATKSTLTARVTFDPAIKIEPPQP
jgi:hypothetical protein